ACRSMFGCYGCINCCRFNKHMKEKKARLLRECVLLGGITSFDRVEEVIVSPSIREKLLLGSLSHIKRT
nr:hypothetical protein [Tanacetum cinerariifolium]